MPRGCAIGIDPGERWVGVARAPRGASLALPVGTLDRTDGDAAVVESLQALLGGEPVAQLVIGVPVRPDGREDEQAARFRRFGEALAESLSATCIAQEERFSSRTAAVAVGHSERKARSPGRKSVQRRRRERQRSHAEAAARILQRWLDAQAGARARARVERGS